MWLSLLGAGIQGAWAWTWDGATIQEPASQGELPASCSVVVCCHNEAHRMARLAEDLRPALDHAEGLGMVVTVVAVNHGSTDDTQRELEHVARLDARWHVVSVPRTQASKKEALNAAMDAATGDVRVMTDADCVPSDVSWLSHMARGANAMWDVCVGISLPVEPSHGRLGWLARCQRLEARRLAQRATGAVDAGRPYLAFGRNMAVTSHMWARVGGFDGHMHVPSGDDDLWLQEAARRGARVSVHPVRDAQTASEWPASWGGWRRQKTRHFTASPSYPWQVKARLLVPGLGWTLLAAGVVHNPSGTSVALAGFALLSRALTFGMFLHRAGLPGRDAWELLLEPVVSAFRVWAWWKGSTSESTPWK